MKLGRRQFMAGAGAVTLGFLGLRQAAARQVSATAAESLYGPLIADPRKILDLPQGFTYDVFSRAGERMDDGFLVPGSHDGMAAFRGGPGGRTILIRNHELRPDAAVRGPFGQANELLPKVPAGRMYDRGSGSRPCLGGTTTVVYDTVTRKVEGHFLSLAGTIRNCAGGATPWGTWLTCEEDVQTALSPYEKNHGYCFEVPATDKPGLAEPVPLAAMGRFYREAVAVDSRTGIVYQTEDRDDGLLYRFAPDRRGDLHSGRLQALKIRGMEGADLSNRRERTIRAGQHLPVEWVDLDAFDSAEDNLRFRGLEAGAARFCRGEGMWAAADTIYFTCTSGGFAGGGQVWKYAPRSSTLELFIEPDSRDWFEMGDNLTMSPWGDLLICEDGPEADFLIGVTPAGKLYRLAKNSLNDSEIAGAVFSPDGSTLFLNLYTPGLTLAVRGPWQRKSS